MINAQTEHRLQNRLRKEYMNTKTTTQIDNSNCLKYTKSYKPIQIPLLIIN